jgi:putative salt-induced outer membrane protein YdiY
MKPRKYAFLFLVIGSFLLPCNSIAEQVVMKNGDVISGQVKKIEDGELFIDPDYADEFALDMAAVESIRSETLYEIGMADGSEIFAKFIGGADGRQTFAADDDELDVGMTELLEASEPELWYDRVSHIDVNMVWNGGNTNSRNNLLFFDTNLKTGAHRQLFELTVRRDKTEGISTKEQDLFRYGYNWIFNEPWYLGVTAGYERDPIRELDYRHVLGALFGRDIFNDRRRIFTVSVGAGYTSEEIGGEKDSGPSALWHLRYEHEMRDGDIEFYHNQTLMFQSYGDHNTILKTNTGFRFDLLKDIYANVSLRYDYETDPALGAENKDSTLVFGVGAEF